MRLTQQTDYALRTLLYLGSHPEQICSAAEIGRGFGVSPNNLVKVGQKLAALGLVETVRGRAGGLRLVVPPAEIRVGQVIRRVEPNLDPLPCLHEDDGCPIAGACRLQSVLARARDAFLSVLDGFTLEDLLTNRTQLVQLLGGRSDAE